MSKILVVDDEVGILNSTALLLSELGFEVTTTSDHGEVLPTLRKERPSLLLQDVRMPGLDLDGLMRAIRQDPVVGKTPVVLFSANMDLRDVQERVGATGYLEKPFKTAELLQVVQSAIQEKTA